MMFSFHRITAVSLCLVLVACAGGGGYNSKSIGSLNKKKVKVEDPIIEDSLEKAMEAYKQFLKQTPETAVTPEAMRRLADLKLEAGAERFDVEPTTSQAPVLQTPQDRAKAAKVKQQKISEDDFGKSKVSSDIMATDDTGVAPTESEYAFEDRATKIADLEKPSAVALPGGDENQNNALTNTEEAIKLYEQLLEKYPLYERNDQVLYQLARSYEEGGRQEEAMQILNRLVKEYPTSRHYDEAQFRRGEIFFVRKKYFPAEQAYDEVIKIGTISAFYDQALFKKGWALFKQSLYKEGLDDFVSLLDIKTAAGYHLNKESNKTEYQRMEDTFRVMSLSFSYIGGAQGVADYFQTKGARSYEDMIYGHLAHHYLAKRRYSDAASSYNTFVELYPLHKRAPEFQMRVIEVYKKGNFPKLVIEGKRDFAIRYSLNSEYWTYHDISEFSDILAFMKTNLVDLAKHYHALSQKSKKAASRKEAYQEAVVWYREFLESFPEDPQAPNLNFLLAEILFDNKDYLAAALEYEKTAYAYEVHEKSSESGYAAVLAYREYENEVFGDLKAQMHQEMIRSSLQFAETYPVHPQAAAVLTSAAENLFALNEFERAIQAAQGVIQNHPNAKPELRTSAWTVIGHSSFDLNMFVEAENAYHQVLQSKSKKGIDKKAITERLAASIYKQAEEHQTLGDLQAAVDDFLRIAQVAPKSPIRVTAEYDAGAALINLEKWDDATRVLQAFRKNYPRNKLQFDVTKKLAFVHHKNGKAALAAREYERIANETDDPVLRKEAMFQAAELYEEGGNIKKAIQVYLRYVKRYPEPIEEAIESRQHIADLYQKTNKQKEYIKMLKEIVRVDSKAGAQRTDRTRYLAAKAAFVLAEPVLIAFNKSRLGEPFQKTLKAKKKKMQVALKVYGNLADYEVAEVTAAATYQIAGIYYQFSVDLLESERPKNLSVDELEQYELILEEQAYPFEEKAIDIHEKNVELMTNGIYNSWVGKSIEQLADLIPVRYNKKEKGVSFVQAIN